eukprot:gene7013-12637_t
MAEGIGPPLFSTLHRVISSYFKNIEKVGQYYKGYVDGEDNYKNFLDDFSAVSSNSFCVRTSVERKNYHSEDQLNNASQNSNKEQGDEDQRNAAAEGVEGKAPQRRLNRTEGDPVWQSTRGHNPIEFFGSPFKVESNVQLECTYGQNRHDKNKEDSPEESINNHPSWKKRRMRLQDSRKLGCPAKIFVRSITVYQDYDISDKAKTESRRHFDRFTKKEWLQKLKENIGNPDLKIFKRYYLCVPDQCAHTSHAVGVFAGLGQPINQKVKEQIHKLTNSGVSDVQTMRELLKDFILNDMFAHTSRKPDVLNTAFFPRDRCIANHMYIAATKQKLSCMDQVNLQQRIKEWEQQDPERKFSFRASKICDGGEDRLQEDLNSPNCDNSTAISKFNPHQIKSRQFDQKLLYVHQEPWQQDLLKNYGNNICLMDATYKTTKYALPLFFVIVNTNAGYKVAAEFITQEENTESVEEALLVLKNWNPSWKPQFFMCDYSQIEINAIESVFSECGTKVLICAFHREQAWERWTKRKESTLSHEERKKLLRYLRTVADAPANDEENTNPFQLSVDNLKSTHVWNSKPNVREYINQWWLSCPERWARAFRESDLDRNVNTNNGAESLNKLLKYKFLKKSAEKSLCAIISLVIDKFLPHLYREFLTANVKSRETNGIRSYGSFVPPFLKGRPRKFIEHCLPRIKNAETDFNGNKNLLRTDIGNKLFEVKSSNDQKDTLPAAYLQQDFLKVDDRLLHRALADSACLEDATLETKIRKKNSVENDTGVEVNIGHNVDNVNKYKERDSLDEFENYESFQILKSQSAKILRRKCISSLETLKNKIFECHERVTLKETLDTLNDMVKRVNKTLLKDPSQSIPLTSCKSQALIQNRTGTKDKILPLKRNNSRKRKQEHWRSRGRCGQAASAFRESKKFKLSSEDKEKEVEVSIVTGDLVKSENVANSTPVPEEFYESAPASRPGQNVAKPTCSADRSAIPLWGGSIATGNRVVKLSNTCPVDNWLMLLAVANLAHSNAYRAAWSMAYNDEIAKVFRFVPLCQYLEAKLHIAKMNGLEPVNNTINMYGNEQELFIRYLSFAFEHSIRSTCSSPACPQGVLNKTFKLFPRLPGSTQYLADDVTSFVNEWLLNGSLSRCGRKMQGESFPIDLTFPSEQLNTETGKK